MDIVLSVGNIIIDETNNKKYRVIAIVKNEITLCEMNITALSLSVLNMQTLLTLMVWIFII